MNALNEQYEVAALAAVDQAADLLSQSETDPIVADTVEQANARRWGAVEDLRLLRAAQSYLPELPEATAQEVFERVVEAERRWASPDLSVAGYGEGVAEYDDEVRVARGFAPVLMSADHATDPVRKATGIREAADHGTGGLAAVLAEEGWVDAVIPVGRQTGNVNVNVESHAKEVIMAELNARRRLGFVSLHGKVPGHVSGLLDDAEIHAFLGLGKYAPSDETLAAADQIRQVARDELGLRVEVANTTPFLVYKKDNLWVPGGPIRDKSSELSLTPEGKPKVSMPEPKLAALGDGTTTNFVREYQRAESGHEMPAFQIEMSRSLRLTPQEQWNRDPKQMAMGVYLGYMLNKRIVEICLGLGAQSRVDI